MIYLFETIQSFVQDPLEFTIQIEIKIWFNQVNHDQSIISFDDNIDGCSVSQYTVIDS